MEDEKMLNQLQIFVEGHSLKNHLYYFAHEHRMVLYDEKETDYDIEICCSGCSSPIKASTAMYGCTQCQCFFHKPCAELPLKINHPSHKSHSLTLLQDPTQNPSSLSLPDDDDEIRNSKRCLGCNLQLRGSIYGCIDCGLFFHKFCLELPPELPHFIHPKHRLFLNSDSVNDTSKFMCRACFERRCFDCGQYVMNYEVKVDMPCRDCSKFHTGFSYHCDKCEFSLGIPCIFSLTLGFDRTMGHILSISTKPNLEEAKALDSDCLACGEELGLHDFFECVQCRFILHIHCVLPSTFKSVHHRHPLELCDSHIEEENTDEFYCDHCETERRPGLAVYKCPVKGCSFVAHCYCEFLQGNLSIAHKLDNIMLDTSTVMIKNPTLTVDEMTSNFVGELTRISELVGDVGNKEEWASKELLKENEEITDTSTKDRYVKAFVPFLKRYISRYIYEDEDEVFDPEASNNAIVVKIGEYQISKKLAPVLKALFTRYGNFTVESTLSQMPMIFVFNILRDAMYNMCNTKDVDITESLLFTWLDNFRYAQFAGFEIQFAFDRFRKALHAYFGLIYPVNPLMDELDRDMANLIQEVEATSNCECTSNHRISSIVTNLSGECSGETIELQNVYKAHTSWLHYFMEIGEIVVTDEYELDDIYHRGKISTSEAMSMFDNNKTISIWDYQNFINNIKTFFEQHPMMNTNGEMEKNDDGVCYYECELSMFESPFYKCTKCDTILQLGMERPQQKSCFGGDHSLTPLQEPPVEISEKEIFYATSWCYLCALPLWGSSYHCEEHGNFHKSCIKIPLEIQHCLHPTHPLVLNMNFRRVEGVKCYACGENCRRCAFSCESCNFYVEVQCIFRELTIRSQSHEHLLTLIEEKTEHLSRRCSHCKKYITCHPFLYCGLCDFSFHFRCSLPSTITSSCHRHPLTIVDSHKEDDGDEFYCDACEERRKPNDPVYYCLECNNYVAHIGCAIAKVLPSTTN